MSWNHSTHTHTSHTRRTLTRIHVNSHAHPCVLLHLHKHVCTYTHIFSYTRTHTNTFAHTLTFMCKHTCTRAHSPSLWTVWGARGSSPALSLPWPPGKGHIHLTPQASPPGPAHRCGAGAEGSRLHGPGQGSPQSCSLARSWGGGNGVTEPSLRPPGQHWGDTAYQNLPPLMCSGPHGG